MLFVVVSKDEREVMLPPLIMTASTLVACELACICAIALGQCTRGHSEDTILDYIFVNMDESRKP